MTADLRPVTEWLPRAAAGFPVGRCSNGRCDGMLHPATHYTAEGDLALDTVAPGGRDLDLQPAPIVVCDTCGCETVCITLARKG